MRAKISLASLKSAFAVCSIFLIAFSFSRSFPIAVAISLVVSAIANISTKRGNSRKLEKLSSVLPEIIDHIISGLQSGLSLSETLSNLAERGPRQSQIFFERFKTSLKMGLSFEQSITLLQNEMQLRAADQLFESLIFAKNLGGSELLSMLRQLGDFTRQDLSLRREISAKQDWIKNSAHLSAAAPWILLLLLAAQPSTATAFNSPQGVAVLGFGAGMTALAYLWMGKLGSLPEPQRIFGAHK